MAKSNFRFQVYQLVEKIPKGQVWTYGQIARRLGEPRAAQAVGNALHENQSLKIPCHRVVDQKGFLATNFGQGGWREQAKRLKAEGVKFISKKKVVLLY